MSRGLLPYIEGEQRLLSIIGDQDTVLGFLLAGIGDTANGKNNFLIVNETTPHSDIESAFRSFTERNDIAVVLITQTIASDIRYLLNEYDKVIPMVLEIPAKEAPYDVSKDYIMQRFANSS